MRNRMLYSMMLVLLMMGTTVRGWTQDSALDNPPAIPGRMLDRIQTENHPFLLADLKQFQEAWRQSRRELLEDRDFEFNHRIVGFFNPKSPWYLGEGPLSENKDFHPGSLSEEDWRFYTKIICEALVYVGMEKEKWAILGMKREFQRLLDDLIPESTGGSASVESGFTDQQAHLLLMTSLVYDAIYNRFDAIERHPFNNRLNQIRLQLASSCAATDPATLPPASRIVRGTALGLSTLMCISIYSFEWEKQKRFSVQSFLPDLYRAVTYTHSGLQDFSAACPQLSVPLPELEQLMLESIPWMECMQRMGYPYQLQQGVYNAIVNSFETHRMPNSNQIIHPYAPANLHDPWIPRTQTVFVEIAEKMYPKKDKPAEPFVPFSGPIADASPSGEIPKIPQSFQPVNVNIQKPGKTLSLREELERYGFPRKPTPMPFPQDEQPRSNPDAGWTPPDLRLPSVWGSVYLLAERDDPQSQAGELWEKYAVDVDSHPYTFLYYSEFPLRGQRNEEKTQLVRYPDIGMTLMANTSNKGRYLLTSQAASATLLLPTYAADHESFLLSDGTEQWRWFQEIPSGTKTASATSTLEFKRSHQANPVIEDATALSTSLFTCWTTYSPSGRTLAFRRHLGGVGSGYTAVAHFPDSAAEHHVEYVIFSVPSDSQWGPLPDVPDQYCIAPPGARTSSNDVDFDQWRRKQQEARIGDKSNGPVSGVFNVVFSPESIKTGTVSEGSLGRILEIPLAHPEQPFFYLCTEDQRGREMFEVKYATVPTPGLRVIEWNQGIEIIAVKMGNKIENSFIESDADFVVIMRDKSMKGLFYFMDHGTYLRCKFAPTQEAFQVLVSAPKDPVTVAWSTRRLYTTAPPRSGSAFYAPDALGFDCPGYIIQYGLKNRQAVVFGNKLDRRK